MFRSTLVIFFALFSSVCLKADDMAYVGANGGPFGTIDLNTGAFTSAGNSGQTLAGLAVANGSIFATSYHVANSTLYNVNPSNGALTSIGSTGIEVDDFGSTTGGMYAVDTSANLYSINSSTGAATLVGSTGLGLGSWRSLSTNSATLYFADGADLYTLNTSTGTPTLVGAFNGSAEEGALLFEDGFLYGGDNVNNTVDTINTVTGAATLGATSGVGSAFWGLAPYPVPTPASSTPEPASWVLLGLGFAAALVARTLRRFLRASNAN